MDTTELVVTQHVVAPVGQVWSAWTSAEGWARWWWPQWEDTEYVVDARPGGPYSARSAQGGTGVEGEFVTLEAPRRLEMTWRWDGEAAEDRVIIELTEDEVKELNDIDKTHHFRACHPNWTGWGSLGFPDCAEEGSKFI